jgi:stress-induced morphogen
MVNDLLGDLFKQGLHALEIHAKSPHEKPETE